MACALPAIKESEVDPCRARVTCLAAACVVAIVLLTVALASCGSKGSGSATRASSGTPAGSEPERHADHGVLALARTECYSPGASAPAGFKADLGHLRVEQRGFRAGHRAGPRRRGGAQPRSGSRAGRSSRRRRSGSAAADATARQRASGAPLRDAVARLRLRQGPLGDDRRRRPLDGTAAPAGAILSLATIDGQVLALAQPSPSSTERQAGAPTRSPAAPGATVDDDQEHRFERPHRPDLDTGGRGGGARRRRRDRHHDGGLIVHAPRPRTPRRLHAERGRRNVGALAGAACGRRCAAGSVSKVVYTSASGGATWNRAGAPLSRGRSGHDRRRLARDAPRRRRERRAARSIDSTDGGHAWSTALTYGDGGAGWADLGFTTPTDAVVIHGAVDASGDIYGRPGQLLLSANGGASWHAVNF